MHTRHIATVCTKEIIICYDADGMHFLKYQFFFFSLTSKILLVKNMIHKLVARCIFARIKHSDGRRRTHPYYRYRIEVNEPSLIFFQNFFSTPKKHENILFLYECMRNKCEFVVYEKKKTT